MQISRDEFQLFISVVMVTGKKYQLKAIMSESLKNGSGSDTSYYAVAVVKKDSPLTIATLKVGHWGVLFVNCFLWFLVHRLGALLQQCGSLSIRLVFNYLGCIHQYDLPGTSMEDHICVHTVLTEVLARWELGPVLDPSLQLRIRLQPTTKTT